MRTYVAAALVVNGLAVNVNAQALPAADAKCRAALAHGALSSSRFCSDVGVL